VRRVSIPKQTLRNIVPKLARAAAILPLALFIAVLPADAQKPARVPRIGVLLSGSSSTTRHYIEAFRQGLRELGHIEGQNIAVE
jgi:putative ABC transport system substrate-binding protein